MKFRIEKSPFGSFSRYRLINTETGEYVGIVPEFGGRVIELVLSNEEQLLSVLDGYQTQRELLEDTAYKSAKLLPFANRVAEGRYRFNGKVFQLSINAPAEGHAIHGFLFSRPFTVANSEETSEGAVLYLEYPYSGDVPGYPFPFSVQLELRMAQLDGFSMTTRVKNTGTTTMPLSDGWHPYFTFQKPIDRLLLQLPSVEQTELDDRMIPTGISRPFSQFQTPQTIGTARFDHNFRLLDTGARAITSLADPEQNCSLRIWQETGEKKYNFLQVYIPPSRYSIAIEPMTSNVDAFNNRQWLIQLEPGEYYSATCGVQLQRGLG